VPQWPWWPVWSQSSVYTWLPLFSRKLATPRSCRLIFCLCFKGRIIYDQVFVEQWYSKATRRLHLSHCLSSFWKWVRRCYLVTPTWRVKTNWSVRWTELLPATGCRWWLYLVSLQSFSSSLKPYSNRCSYLKFSIIFLVLRFGSGLPATCRSTEWCYHQLLGSPFVPVWRMGWFLVFSTAWIPDKTWQPILF